MNICFDLAQMAAILDFTYNAMTNVRSCHTRMSDNKIMLVLLFCPKLYQFILFYLAQMAAILDFIHNAMSKVLFYYITEARMLDTKIKNLRLFILLFDLVEKAAVLDFVTFRCLK